MYDLMFFLAGLHDYALGPGPWTFMIFSTFVGRLELSLRLFSMVVGTLVQCT